MNRRFAQIVAAATDRETGQIDRARLFAALETDPRDPIAAIFDAAAFTFATVEELKATLPEALEVKFREMLAQFAALQTGNSERAKSASASAQQACEGLERWALEFAAASRSDQQREIAAIREAAVKALTESGAAARSAQQTIRRTVDDLQISQLELLGRWERIHHIADDSAAILNWSSLAVLVVLLAIAFGIGYVMGGRIH